MDERNGDHGPNITSEDTTSIDRKVGNDISIKRVRCERSTFLSERKEIGENACTDDRSLTHGARERPFIDCISVGVDRMHRNFEPMRKQVEAWQKSELTDVTAKVVIYEAFLEGKLEAPKHLAWRVHDLYFEPRYEEFRSRTIWSLSNAFTSAFKELDPIPQFKATAKLGEFLETRFSQSF